MNTTLVLGVALGLGAPALKDPPKKDASVVGEWEVESVGMNGPPTGVGGLLRYTFTADGKWLIFKAGQELPLAGGTRTFTQDPKPNPPAVDLVTTRPGAAAERRLLGIFKVEGDTLTICGTRTKGAERPKTFEPGPGITFYVLKRAKPKD